MSLNVEMIRASFEKAKPIGDQVVAKFYEFLWGDYPASKAMFADVNMEVQQKALLNSLVYVVDHVDQPEKLVPYLEKMGERHVGYGTKKEHYDMVGASLLKTFAHFFGDEWTPELKAQWTMAYGFIAETMLKGATHHVPDTKEIKGFARDVCNQLFKEVLEQGFDKEFEQYVRARVRKILYKTMEEEAQQLFGKKAA